MCFFICIALNLRQLVTCAQGSFIAVSLLISCSLISCSWSDTEMRMHFISHLVVQMSIVMCRLIGCFVNICLMRRLSQFAVLLGRSRSLFFLLLSDSGCGTHALGRWSSYAGKLVLRRYCFGTDYREGHSDLVPRRATRIAVVDRRGRKLVFLVLHLVFIDFGRLGCRRR